MRALFLAVLLTAPVSAETTITLLHVSDYHSHALPFYTEEGERGGIARAWEYLRREKGRGALVFHGGDTMNEGAPAWSDHYRCAEWPWFNGVVDAMAFGNHEPDYGLADFERCRRAVQYPVLSANTEGFRPYVVLEVRGIRIGVFAVAGADFPSLVKVPGFEFSDPVAAAKAAVAELRGVHRADAVVMIGHQHAEADYALARAVGGIDLIFGSHSHLVRELTLIPGTSTWFISPGQYLTWISRVEMVFSGRRLEAVRGKLVAVDDRLPESRRIAGRVQRMQRELERHPDYRDLFVPFARLDQPLHVDELTRLTVDRMRAVAGADVALTTKSSIRRPLPAGNLTMELLRGALPYDNELVVCELSGRRLQEIVSFSKAKEGSGSEAVFSGAGTFDPEARYRVATTDYLAATAYAAVFGCTPERTGVRVRDEMTRYFASTPARPTSSSEPH